VEEEANWYILPAFGRASTAAASLHDRLSANKKEGKRRGEGKRGLGAKEEPKYHQNTKPEQDCGMNKEA
jgi:hypothetical protein